MQVGSLFRRHELEKKREYGDRVRSVESASFTPLVFSRVFSTFGGLGREATIFYSRLANLLAVRHNINSASSYSQMLSCMDALYHLFLPTSICHLIAIRGSRTLTFAERPSISTSCAACAWWRATLILLFNLLKLAFVTNDDLLILDCLFSHLIWSDVMIKNFNITCTAIVGSYIYILPGSYI